MIVSEYAEQVLADLRAFADDDLPNYSDCLRKAFSDTEPVFVRSRYGEFFWHCATTVPGWLAKVVLANADAESGGSAKLLKLWKGIHSNSRVSNEVLAHAKDEAGHSRLFVTLARSAFPLHVSARTAAAKKKTLTHVQARIEKSVVAFDEGHVVDHLVQMNIGEIRTRAHMHLIGPAVFNSATARKQPWVEKTLQRLGGDEVRHIGYTARLMEEWCREGYKNRIDMLYRLRLREFHSITVAQTESAVHSYGNNNYPDLLEI